MRPFRRVDVAFFFLFMAALALVAGCRYWVPSEPLRADPAPAVTSAEVAPWVTDFSKPFNEYSWVTAHNAYGYSMSELLGRGIRGFMLDLHERQFTSEVAVCHADTLCAPHEPLFKDIMINTFLPFLKSNPTAVLTLHLESTVSRDNMTAAVKQIPELAQWVFDPAPYSGTASWPTLQQLIDSGKRLVIFGEKAEIAGMFEDGSGAWLTVLRDKEWEVQNEYDLGASSDNWLCLSRWSDVDMTTHNVNWSGFTRWPRLFVMNQFHAFNFWGAAHSGDRDNNLTFLERRVDEHCASTSMFRRMPNYIALDNTHVGDGFAYAAALSQGGFYFYEKNNADTSGDTVCVLPASQDWDLSFKSTGCENDEARSMKVRGVKAGTRVTLYDSPSGDRQDDYAIIYIKKDADLGGFSIPSFEREVDNADYRLVFSRNNGLDGKVSRVKIERSPVDDFSDAAVVLYEGNNASQNIVCTISLANNERFNFGGDCDNDEARSLRVLKAKAGSSLTLYGNKDYKTDQGWVYIYFRKDILVPTVIPTFEGTIASTTGWVTFRRGSSNQLDGKVSSVITWNGGENYFQLKNKVSGLCLNADEDYAEAFLWHCGVFVGQHFALRSDHIQSMTEGYPYLIDSNYRIRSVRNRPADPGIFSYNFSTRAIEIRRNGLTQCAQPVSGAALLTGLYVTSCSGNDYEQWEILPIR